MRVNPWLLRLQLPDLGSNEPLLGLAHGVEEHIVISDGFLDKLDEEKHFRWVHHRVDPLLEGLKRIKRGQRKAKEEDYRVAAHGHGHTLQLLQAFVFLWCG